MGTKISEEIGLGDLEKTVIVNTLMQTPLASRDEAWRDQFLQNIDGANLKMAQQEVAIGPDGFPYIQLETVNCEEDFKAFVINKQLPNILQQGFGIVINVGNENPDWVFSYGDIVNFELNDSFYSNESLFTFHRNKVDSIAADEELLVGQPSESILPKYLKNQLREFLKHAGIKFPKVMLLARNHQDEHLVSQDLVFNFTPNHFANEAAFNQIMHTLSWFMPKHYSFFCIDETQIENGFELI